MPARGDERVGVRGARKDGDRERDADESEPQTGRDVHGPQAPVLFPTRKARVVGLEGFVELDQAVLCAENEDGIRAASQRISLARVVAHHGAIATSKLREPREVVQPPLTSVDSSVSRSSVTSANCAASSRPINRASIESSCREPSTAM